jgi:hypothetical protein
VKPFSSIEDFVVRCHPIIGVIGLQRFDTVVPAQKGFDTPGRANGGGYGGEVGHLVLDGIQHVGAAVVHLVDGLCLDPRFGQELVGSAGSPDFESQLFKSSATCTPSFLSGSEMLNNTPPETGRRCKAASWAL